jgi:flavoprotein
MGRRLFLDEPSALPELMISLRYVMRLLRCAGCAGCAGACGPRRPCVFIQTLYAEVLNLS